LRRQGFFVEPGLLEGAGHVERSVVSTVDTFDLVLDTLYAENTGLDATNAIRAFIRRMFASALRTPGGFSTPFAKVTHPQTLKALRGAWLEAFGSMIVILQKYAGLLNPES
jgi:hypothetical protein